MSTLSILAAICMTLVGQENSAAPDSVNALTDLQRLLRPAQDHNKLSFLHRRSLDLVDVLNRSRWRNSIPEAVRILVGSSNSDDRKTGWKLAQERVFKMNWTVRDIQRVLEEPVEEVKMAAVRSLAVTDRDWVGKCIEEVMKDPTATVGIKRSCLTLLSTIPVLSDRERLWLTAAHDGSFRADCASAFSAVSFSEPAVLELANYLDDTSLVNVAVSHHVGRPSELRTLAVVALRTVDIHKHIAADEIRKRCQGAPAKDHLEFFIAAMISIHALVPETSEPVDLIEKWYDELSDSRPFILQSLEGEFPNSAKLERQFISSVQTIAPTERFTVCQWLSGRKSPESTEALQKLMLDPHPGVRLAAAVAITRSNPLHDLSALREDLLKSAVSTPDDFMIAFSSMSEAVAALAAAGQSNEEAIEWLTLSRSPELRARCDKALDHFLDEMALVMAGQISWKEVRR